jgi:hypothetical protein
VLQNSIRKLLAMKINHQFIILDLIIFFGGGGGGANNFVTT